VRRRRRRSGEDRSWGVCLVRWIDFDFRVAWLSRWFPRAWLVLPGSHLASSCYAKRVLLMCLLDTAHTRKCDTDKPQQ